MFEVNCSLSENASEGDKLSSYDLGHMDFRGDLGAASSSSRTPDQAMMLVPSIVLLLDGLRKFLSSSTEREYTFIGIDCSFSVVFSKKKEGKVSVVVDERELHICGEAQLKADVEASISQFIEHARATLPASDAASCDLDDAFQAFREFSVD